MARRRERIDRPSKVLSEDLYALASFRTLLYLALPRVLPAATLVGLALFVPNPYLQRVLSIAATYALLALSWDFLASTTGLVSLGQALFFGVGAYAAAVLNTQLGITPFISVVAAALLGGALCSLLLAPCLSLRGIYFSMTTLVYPLLLSRLIEASGALGGTDGILGIEPFPSRGIARLTVVVVLITLTFSLRRLLSTDLGIQLKAIGDDDLAAEASGVRVTRFRLLSIFIAATCGAFAGAFFTHVYMFTGLSAFAMDLSVLPIACAVLGGMGTLAGPVLGAFLLLPLSEAMRDLGSLRIVLYSTLLVLAIVWKPEGLFNFLRRRYEQVERWIEV